MNRIAKTNDSCLVREFLKLVVSFENSSDETISITTAEIFYNNPDVFSKKLQLFSSSERKILAKNQNWGWQNLSASKGSEDRRIKRLSKLERKLIQSN